MYDYIFFGINNISDFVSYLQPTLYKFVQQIRMSFSYYRKSKHVFGVRIGVGQIRVLFCTFNEKHPLKISKRTWVSLYFLQTQKEEAIGSKN